MSRRRRSQKPWRMYRNLLVLALGFALLVHIADLVINYPLPALVSAGVVVLGTGYLVYRIRRRRRFRHKTLGELLMLSPAQFEIAIAQLFRDLGYRNVQRVGQPGDLTADIRCRDRKGRSVIIQCKRYAPGARIGSRDLQTFIGMLKIQHQADAGIFVTTSSFTGPARQLAQQHSIELVDDRKLMQLIEQAQRARQTRPAAEENMS